jgi:hypothetical protein
MGFLRRLLGGTATVDGPAEARVSEPGEGPFDVEPVPGEWQYQVTFDDVVAHEEEDRVASFVERLSEEPRIGRAVHEDREIVLIQASGLPAPEMQAIAERVWADTEHETTEDQLLDEE